MKKIFSLSFASLIAAMLMVASPVQAYSEPDFDYYFYNVPECSMDIMVPDTNVENGTWNVYTDEEVPVQPYGFSDAVSFYYSEGLISPIQGAYFRCMNFAGDRRELYQYFRQELMTNHPSVTHERTGTKFMFDANIPVFEMFIDNGFTRNRAFLFVHNGKGYLFEMQRTANAEVFHKIVKSVHSTQFN